MTLSMGASYIYPTKWSVYFCSLISGFGEAIIWVAQGPELLDNSTDENIGLNSSIFWFLYQVKTSLCFAIDFLCFRFPKPEVVYRKYKSISNNLALVWSICWKFLCFHGSKRC